MRQGRRYGLFCGAKRLTYGAVGRPGESLHEIGRAFGKDHRNSIQFFVIAARRDSSSRSSALTANAYVGRAGRDLMRDSFRFVDSRDRQRLATGGVYGESGGGASRRPSTISSQ